MRNGSCAIPSRRSLSLNPIFFGGHAPDRKSLRPRASNCQLTVGFGGLAVVGLRRGRNFVAFSLFKFSGSGSGRVRMMDGMQWPDGGLAEGFWKIAVSDGGWDGAWWHLGWVEWREMR